MIHSPKLRLATLVLSGTLLTGSPSILWADEPALDGVELKTMVQNLGYTVKSIGTDPDSPKFEIATEKEGLNVPLALEVSKSKRYIWVTAFLGETSALAGMEARARKMLERNASIQPSSFYITSKGKLMIGIAVENRNVTPAILRWRIDRLVSDVAATKEVWSN